LFHSRTTYPRYLFTYVLKSKGFAVSGSTTLPLPPTCSTCVRARPGSCAFAAAAAWLAGFGLAAPCECDYCLVIIEKPLELGVQKIKLGY